MNTNHRGIPPIPTKRKSNSPFDWHKVEHLSVSTINTWVMNPSSILYKIAGGKDDAGPSAWRGNATETALYHAMQDPNQLDEVYHNIALNDFDKRTKKGHDWRKIDIQRKHTVDYVNAGLSFYKKLGVPSGYQKRILVEFDELEIPFVGYIDFEFGEKGKNHQIRDLKTSVQKLNRLSDANCRQLALYQKGAGDSDTALWIDSCSRHEIISLRLKNAEPYLKDLLHKALGLRKFLSTSSDINELLQMIQPDYDHWLWSNAETKKQAKVIWEKKID